MAAMPRIEFLNHPDAGRPTDVVWGVLVDGVDLRVHTADATRDLWRSEADEDDPAEEERFLREQHGGLSTLELDDPVRHFLGEPAPDFAGPDAAPGTTPVLGCSCGIWGCWPLLAVITATPGTVTWSSFRQPFRTHWGELPLGPWTFARPAYEAALAAPARLPEDPLRAG